MLNKKMRLLQQQQQQQKHMDLLQHPEKDKQQQQLQLHSIKYMPMPPAKLTVSEEVLSGCIGGALSTWNQPFEVARIQMQSAAAEGQKNKNIIKV
ncbi:mitochondrial carrier protein, putative [Eimeria tenella]|nr:mitochondrial carrier protein, putative [Eimeria tenella]CDJ44986.1 mitochondrial carrier protein, putative [Eimeria tenella]|eukprot:XP_013235733.1 mitochondrial carrier protein, putative [Eimeria tenella]